MTNNFSEKANFIRSIADLIRDTFRRGRYQDVILPFTVLRRIDQVLEPTKDEVLATYNKYKDRFDEVPPRLLCKASGYAFYNTSPYTFERLLADPHNLADNLHRYLGDFSPNMREVLANFEFDNTIERLDQAGLLYMVDGTFHHHRPAPGHGAQPRDGHHLRGADPPLQRGAQRKPR
jgi:type I restriction enzyme M protein